MQIKQLEAFVLVAETGSFTKAAKILFMTQPAISFQIKSLEQELGVTVLERSDKKVFVTEVGRLLYQESKEILSRYEKVLSYVSEIKGLAKGTLYVGASTIPGEYIMPKIIGSFKNLYEGIDISLRIGSSKRISELLLEREIQIGITGACPDNPLLEAEPFLMDEIVPILSPTNPLAQRGPLTMEEFLQGSLIMREEGSGTRKAVERAIYRNDQEKGRKVSMELGSTRAIITAVEANLGVSFVSKWAIKDQIRTGSLEIADIPSFSLNRELFIVTPKNYGVKLLVDTFFEHLKKHKGLI